MPKNELVLAWTNKMRTTVVGNFTDLKEIIILWRVKSKGKTTIKIFGRTLMNWKMTCFFLRQILDSVDQTYLTCHFRSQKFCCWTCVMMKSHNLAVWYSDIKLNCLFLLVSMPSQFHLFQIPNLGHCWKEDWEKYIL